MPNSQWPEFGETDFVPVKPNVSKPPEPPSKTRYWWFTLLACASAGVVYLAATMDKEVTESSPPGWENLLGCSYTASFDGTKELRLFDNQRAVLYDKSKMENEQYLAIDGNWTFDEITKLYAVTLNGEVTTYSIVKPEQTNICMLVKGDLGAADLRASWFSPASEFEDMENPSYEF